MGKELGQPSSAHLDLSAGTWVEFQQKAALRLRGAGAEQGQGAAEARGCHVTGMAGCSGFVKAEYMKGSR